MGIVRALSLFAAVGLTACSGQDPADAGGADSGPTQDTGIVSPADATPADAGAPADAEAEDSGVTHDAGQAMDAGASPDASPLDGGSEPVQPCGTVQFSLPRPGARTVWVTGTFSNWGATEADGAITLSDMGGGNWSVTTTLMTGGRHQYKFIIDGATWIADPNNPLQEDDGFGGFNSVLEICTQGAFEVRAHRTLSGAFDAQVAYVGTGDPATMSASIDRVSLPAGGLSIDGRLANVHVDGLSPGIHDLRLFVGEQSTLLKIYVDESTDWRDTAMYFVMTDRFVNGDTSNDAPVNSGISNPLADYLGGDFAGVQQQIEAGYFEQLGINALWITWPLDNTDGAFEGPYDTYEGCNRTGQTATRFSGYHGYWPKSGTEIESRFGSRTELEALVDAAHRHGLRVLFDFTANHVHEDSPYYSMHPEWFNLPAQMCRDGLWDGDLREECWFDSFLPDWNFKQAAARRRVLDDAIVLAKDFGADGFRVDALKHMEDVFIEELRDRVEGELQGTDITFYMVGETFTGETADIARYVGPEMLHGQFDFPSNMAIRQGLAIDQVGLDAMDTWVRASKQAYGANSPWMSTFAGNHDISRFVSKAAGDLPCGIWSMGADVSRGHSSPPAQPVQALPYARLRLAMTYAYTVPGIPLMYYGDEVGLAGAGDPDNRRMLPLEGALSAQMRSTRDFMQSLGQLRASKAVLRTGDWPAPIFSDGSLLIFARTLPGDTALIVINRGGARTVEVSVGSLGLSDGTTLMNGLGTESVTVTGGRLSINAPAVQAQIFTQP